MIVITSGASKLFIIYSAIVYSMAQTTTIQISFSTKKQLDDIKEMEDAETFDAVIVKLINERRRNIPSTFGCLKGGPSFVRDEEEDSHRVPH